ncbi:hypothetical protein PRUPE_3G152200 [Prunus persica]|uniref:HMA domain-containing protein n=1 Tax=Prunus persica TaxID=3760 RepID=A0A251Q3T8_PRUPE|nr:heavy metal-associated isoprenylated plant protein 33 [Prunus persica]ONI17335.1 hypothetical protein PRUPE_3G152200 [Prunus persica]
MTTNEFVFVNIKTHSLKVHINCEGCVQKVRKLLRKIEGVYSVHIDAEEQKITVTGNVDFATLIRKLGNAGKHAEPWSPSSNQTKAPMNGLNLDSENQLLLPPFFGSEGQHGWGSGNFVDGNGNLIGAAHHGKLQGNVFPMMGRTGFHGNAEEGLEFRGLQDFSAGFPAVGEYGHSRPVMLTNSEGYPHTNFAPAFMIPPNTSSSQYNAGSATPSGIYY